MINEIVKKFGLKRRKPYIAKARGIYLDMIASNYWIERKKYFWIFKESDKSLRNRIIATIKRV